VSYLVDVLALELRDELVQALVIGLDTDAREDLLDVGSGGGGVAAKAEEEVSCEVLHFECGDCTSSLVSFAGRRRNRLADADATEGPLAATCAIGRDGPAGCGLTVGVIERNTRNQSI